jgi:hypothetical protein
MPNTHKPKGCLFILNLKSYSNFVKRCQRSKRWQR